MPDGSTKCRRRSMTGSTPISLSAGMMLKSLLAPDVRIHDELFLSFGVGVELVPAMFSSE